MRLLEETFCIMTTGRFSLGQALIPKQNLVSGCIGVRSLALAI